MRLERLGAQRLDKLRKLLADLEYEIAALPNGPTKNKRIELKTELEADIRMIAWANSPALRPPTA